MSDDQLQRLLGGAELAALQRREAAMLGPIVAASGFKPGD